MKGVHAIGGGTTISVRLFLLTPFHLKRKKLLDMEVENREYTLLRVISNAPPPQ